MASSAHRIPHKLRIALMCVLLVCLALNVRQVLLYFSLGPMASDFRIFMTGANMLRDGQGKELYNFAAQQAVQTRLYPETRGSGLLPFNHLPYELSLYLPFSYLPYPMALVAWQVLNVAVVLAISRLLRPYTAALRQASGVPVALWLFAFYPVTYVLAEGQDSLLFLLLLVVSLRCLDANRAFMAGFFLALACFKFHLALAIAGFAFVLTRRWLASAGFCAGAFLVFIISAAMTSFDFARGYSAMLRQQEMMTPWGFIPRFMPNLRGLMQWSLSRKFDVGIIFIIVVAVSVLLSLGTAWLVLRTSELRTELAYSLATLTTVLVSYHFHLQDLAIASLPMMLLLNFMCWKTFPSFWKAPLTIGLVLLFCFPLLTLLFPVLFITGCLLTVPLLLLWIANVGLVPQSEWLRSEIQISTIPVTAKSRSHTSI